VERLNAVGRRPEVNCPPPWEDAEKLREWYDMYYRSDPDGAVIRERRKLPKWLEHATFRAKKEREAKNGVEEKPKVPKPAAKKSPLKISDDMSGGEALAHFKRVLAEEMRRLDAMDPDDPARHAAQAAVSKRLLELQQAEKLDRATGEAEQRWLSVFLGVVNDTHAGVVARAIREIQGMLFEAREAVGSQAAWDVFVEKAVSQALDRVSRERVEAAMKGVGRE
jgi:hypothetical protein